jgi:hypothetical protein
MCSVPFPSDDKARHVGVKTCLSLPLHSSFRDTLSCSEAMETSKSSEYRADVSN